MQTRNITVTITSPDTKMPLGIYTSSYEAGRVGDTGVTTLNFVRPAEFESSNLRLIFEIGFDDPIICDLGQSSTFTLTNAQTKATQFKLQVAMTDGTGVIAKSNKLTFYLTSSIPNGSTCNIDYTQELLQFALSQKVSMTRIVHNTPDPTDLSTSTYTLLGFNHLGDLIISLDIPFKEAYEIYKTESSTSIQPDDTDQSDYEPGKVSATDVFYDSTLSNPDKVAIQLTATNVQSALDEILSRVATPAQFSNLSQSVTNLSNSVLELGQSVSTMIDKVGQLELEHQSLQTSINDLTNRVTTLERYIHPDITNLQTQVEKNTADISTLSTTTTDIRSSIISITENIDKLSAKVDAVPEGGDTADTDLTEVNIRLNKNTSDISTLNTQVTELVTNVSTLQTELATTSSSITSLDESVSELNTKTTNLETNVSTNTEAVSTLITRQNVMSESLINKLDISGGTMTGALIAAPSTESETPQLRNIVVYPAGTEVSSINVPPAGTLVVISDSIDTFSPELGETGAEDSFMVPTEDEGIAEEL